MSWLGKKVFISYRGSAYDMARALRDDLQRRGDCREGILVQPDAISARDEILLPFEYFELMEFILDELHSCDAFVILDTGNYRESYWTNEEVKQWRRFSKIPAVFIARPNVPGRAAIVEQAQLGPLNDNMKRLLARISVGTNRRMQANTRGATFWGATLAVAFSYRVATHVQKVAL